jgi:hypothetical protein
VTLLVRSLAHSARACGRTSGSRCAVCSLRSGRARWSSGRRGSTRAGRRQKRSAPQSVERGAGWGGGGGGGEGSAGMKSLVVDGVQIFRVSVRVYIRKDSILQKKLFITLMLLVRASGRFRIALAATPPMKYDIACCFARQLLVP